MVNGWNRKSWLRLFPFHAVLAILLWITPCHAALLLDLRTGEYDKFTRIVFEFDIQPGIDAIEKTLPGELKITFPDVRARLSRPIPQKNSDRLKKFEIWQPKDQLFVIFNFNFPKLRFDSFQLKNPPRLVVDVYQETSQANASKAQQKQIVQESISHAVSVTPMPPDSKRQPSPSPLDRLSIPVDEKPPGATILDSESIKLAISPQQSNQPQTKILNTEAVNSKTVPIQKKGLQYYLLIVLVILTIVILLLLVIMLIARHKWTNGKNVIKINDLFKRQDRHIASINSQIEEQLKRYDEI